MPNILGVEVLYTNLIVEIIIDTWLKITIELQSYTKTLRQ